ncbi:MAG: 23S rRNA (adenine(2503)-C(2))-methyltransferase RlmN [Oligoflexia bacterium]|nr:23S rRNA (adenine(2503)-C(2))-methyltransferase RlmN [Oligoflexia bacterium]
MESLTDSEQPTSSQPQVEGSQSEGVDLLSFNRAELAAFLKERFGAPAYRAEQIFQWFYREGVQDFAQMTNIARELRQNLAQAFRIPEAPVLSRQISNDGTRKYLFGVDRGGAVESVMIKQPKRMTLCVSSQIGCGMGCAFCRTATMGFHRHLATSEILRQVLGVVKDAKNFDDMFQNIVFMGMGEPLHNFDNVMRALSVLVDPKGLAISPRKITVSTVGLVPAIEKFGTSGVDVNLAISLNATTNEIREELMPITKAFPLERLIGALRALPVKGRKKLTIEYVMLHGVNDSADDLRRLPKLVAGLPAKINLIPYNTNAGLGFETPSEDYVRHWQDVLTRKGINTTIRWSKGQDIDAACGQLAVKNLEKRKKHSIALNVLESVGAQTRVNSNATLSSAS